MKKLFTSDKFFLVSIIIAVLGTVFHNSVMLIILYPVPLIYTFVKLICILSAVFLYSSYKKHSKNVMKGLMGALLMAQLLEAIGFVQGNETPVDTVFSWISIILSAVLFINHFIINSDHHSSPAMIKLNQVICVLLAIAFFVWDMTWAFAYGSALVAVASVALALGEFGRYAAVVCVESRLDAYRIAREANGYKPE